jgi:hypothetical protein
MHAGIDLGTNLARVETTHAAASGHGWHHSEPRWLQNHYTCQTSEQGKRMVFRDEKQKRRRVKSFGKTR